MKLLLDQQLSRSLVLHLATAFPDTSHVGEHGLSTSDDDQIWAFALQNHYVIVTKDEDFQVLSFARGHPPKVIWLRTGNGPTKEVLQTLMLARPIITSFGEDQERSMLVLP